MTTRQYYAEVYQAIRNRDRALEQVKIEQDNYQMCSSHANLMQLHSALRARDRAIEQHAVAVANLNDWLTR